MSFKYNNVWIDFVEKFQYSVALLIFFLLELGVAILCFVYPNRVEGLISNYLTDNVISKYREDADLQNLIDFIQQEVKLILNILLCRLYLLHFINLLGRGKVHSK